MRPFHIITIVFLVALCLLIWLCSANQISWWWLLPLFVLYSGLLVLGAIYIQWNFYFVSHNSGSNRKWICLTFDDGPAGETANILDILKEKQVQAAFFSIGKNVVSQPDIVQRWKDEGHIVGNHSYYHGFNFDWKTASAMAKEINDTNAAITSIIGKTPRLFRPPYGVTNPNLRTAIRKTDMVSIGWNVRSFDTTAKNHQELSNRILDKLRGGDIVLLHDSMAITREILTELIDRARQKGFIFVGLDKLLDLDPYA